MGQRLLESFLGQALEALDDHFELSGTLDSDAQQNDRKKTLRFKFYPNGKSKSNDHIAAEGWLGPSTDTRQDEFHFRFTVPKSLTESSSRSARERAVAGRDSEDNPSICSVFRHILR